MTDPTTVDEYLANVPGEQRACLQELRETIHAAAPDATEVMAYKMPGFKQHGGLVYFAAWAKHLALYGIGDSLVERYGDELAPFRGKDATLRFTPQNPIPASLLTKLVKARVAENEAGRDSKPDRQRTSG